MKRKPILLAITLAGMVGVSTTAFAGTNHTPYHAGDTRQQLELNQPATSELPLMRRTGAYMEWIKKHQSTIVRGERRTGAFMEWILEWVDSNLR